MSSKTVAIGNVSTKQLLAAVPFLPSDEDGPVFDEPWQAEVFAIALILHEKGLFTWQEWANQLMKSQPNRKPHYLCINNTSQFLCRQ